MCITTSECNEFLCKKDFSDKRKRFSCQLFASVGGNLRFAREIYEPGKRASIRAVPGKNEVSTRRSIKTLINFSSVARSARNNAKHKHQKLNCLDVISRPERFHLLFLRPFLHGWEYKVSGSMR